MNVVQSYIFHGGTLSVRLTSDAIRAGDSVHIDAVDHHSRFSATTISAQDHTCTLPLAQGFNLASGRLFLTVGRERWALPQIFTFAEHRINDLAEIEASVDAAVLRQNNAEELRHYLLSSIAQLAIPGTRACVFLQEAARRALLNSACTTTQGSVAQIP